MSRVAVQPPSGFEPYGRVERRGGSIDLFARAEPATLWVHPRGFIGPSLLRAELERAAAFGADQPAGWDYVVDTSEVRFVHPLNPLWLRRIRSLPNLGRYLVVAPALSVRIGLRAAGWIVRPDAIVARADDLPVDEFRRS